MTARQTIVKMRLLAEDIGAATADDTAALAIRQESREPGTEPLVILYVNGNLLCEVRRDRLLEHVYVIAAELMTEPDR